MKTLLLVFLLGVALGAIGFYYSRSRQAGADAVPPRVVVSNTPTAPDPADNPASAGTVAASGTAVSAGGTAASGSSASASASGTAAKPTVMEQARGTAVAARDAVAQKLVEWKLTPADIKEELATTSRVVREKARSTGAAISSGVSNARIIAVIKAKYTLDRNLDTAGISVDCDAGKVTLTGTLADAALVGRAITLALDTEGVNEVVSLLTVSASGTPVTPTASATPAASGADADKKAGSGKK
ncbi:MAG: BON domain-containing protein [Opitutaceae bacterium]|jgi:osmotically-inducible protein OsmY|nr:BON domain-containing protein [Opitutaceae bacterium]